MTEVLEPISAGIDKCSEDCPFCKDPELKGYTTKPGKQKVEKDLAKHIRADSGSDITKDPRVGKVYPLPGGGDATKNWLAKAGTFEDFEVRIAAAPHHIIPGKAAMAPSRLERWTLASKGSIKEDIGYSIDCAQNGIFLPHLPEIYWTKYAEGTKKRQSEYYGKSWKNLSDGAKESVAFVLMEETFLQMHYTNHNDPYIYVDNNKNYDDECKKRCNQLSDFMEMKSALAKCPDADDKLGPPYELVAKINAISSSMRSNITGNPRFWSDFVSPLAQEYANSVKTGRRSVTSRGLISREK